MELQTIVLNDKIFIDLKEKIGEGSFGIVRLGVVRDMKENVAVKLETRQDSAEGHLLLNESQALRELQNVKGVPTFYYYGVQDNYHFLVMQLLGESLHHKLRMCKRHLSLHTVLMLLEQMLLILESVHKAGFVYRDIKPHNFLMGLNKRSQDLYLIDYGLTKKASQSIAYSSGSVNSYGISGTLPFISLNSHLGVKPAKRDDLESLAYLVIYLQTGKLPWYVPGQETTERDTRIGKQSAQELIRDFRLPEAFEELVTYARSLKFEQVPDYPMIRAMFRSVADRNRYKYNWVYDWDVIGTQVRSEKRRPEKSVTLLPDIEERPLRSVASFSMASEVAEDRMLSRRNKSLPRQVEEKPKHPRGEKKRRSGL